MTDDTPPSEPKAKILDRHLAKAYDRHVFSKQGWAPQDLADAMKKDPDLADEVTRRYAKVSGVIASRGEMACFVSTIQMRALGDALELAKP